jgi:NodT family efflux transporter outer membrane factor (OMF) lipoprotein
LKITSSTVRGLTPTLFLAAVAGCTVGPDYKKPETAAPGSFASLKEIAEAAPGSVPVGAQSLTKEALATWWKGFEDPTLNSLIERAVAANLDLKTAVARVREARANRGISASAQYPQLAAAGEVTRSRRSQNVQSFPGSAIQNLFDAGLDATYEIDVFGGVRRSVEAADADVGAAIENQRDVLVSVLAEVALAYTDLRGFQERTKLSRQIIAASQETVELTSSRFRAGLSADLEVAQAQAQLATRQADLPVLRAGELAAAHQLAILLGQEPGALLSELEALGTVPKPPSEIPVGLPSDLLERRPDVRRAERVLAGATARIGVATADLYPKFSLTGSFGFQSSKPNNFASIDSRFWSFGPAVQWNLFTGGRVRSEIAAAGARQEQALYAYDQALLNAFGDVEDALTNFVQEQARRRALSAAVDANQRAVSLSTDRYRSGVGDFLNVLDAQRELYDRQEDLVRSEAVLTRNLVQLYKALGGGWTDEDVAQRPPEQPSQPEPTPAPTQPQQPQPGTTPTNS